MTRVVKMSLRYYILREPVPSSSMTDRPPNVHANHKTGSWLCHPHEPDSYSCCWSLFIITPLDMNLIWDSQMQLAYERLLFWNVNFIFLSFKWLRQNVVKIYSIMSLSKWLLTRHIFVSQDLLIPLSGVDIFSAILIHINEDKYIIENSNVVLSSDEYKVIFTRKGYKKRRRRDSYFRDLSWKLISVVQRFSC